MTENKHILITGTTSGIGLGILKHYHALGWKITAFNRRADASLEEKFPKARFYHCNVRDSEGIKSYFKQASETNDLPEIYFLSAGINRVDNAGDFSVETFREVMETNLMGVLNFVGKALPYVTGKNAIFVAASSTSNIFPNPNCIGYYLSKLSLYESFKILERSHGKNGIHFKTLILGPVATNIFVSGQLTSKVQSAVRDFITVSVDRAIPPIVRFIHSDRKVLYYPKLACALFYTLRTVTTLFPGFYKGSVPPAAMTLQEAPAKVKETS